MVIGANRSEWPIVLAGSSDETQVRCQLCRTVGGGEELTVAYEVPHRRYENPRHDAEIATTNAAKIPMCRAVFDTLTGSGASLELVVLAIMHDRGVGSSWYAARA